MPIVVNLDVMMAKRKISAGELAEKVGITPANLSILKNNKAKAIRFSTLKRSAARWTASRRIFWNIENLKKHTERSIEQMHMEPNHEGAASVPQTTGAPILPAERVYQDPSVPAGLKGKKNRRFPSQGWMPALRSWHWCAGISLSGW